MPTVALYLLACLLQEKRVLELERMKGKAEGACRKLEADILSMKQQKVGGHSQSVRSRLRLANL